MFDEKQRMCDTFELNPASIDRPNTLNITKRFRDFTTRFIHFQPFEKSTYYLNGLNCMWSYSRYL